MAVDVVVAAVMVEDVEVVVMAEADIKISSKSPSTSSQFMHLCLLCKLNPT